MTGAAPTCETNGLFFLSVTRVELVVILRGVWIVSIY